MLPAFRRHPGAMTLAWLILGVALGIGLVDGLRTRALQADVRESPPRKAFQAGDEQNQKVLREIADSLKRIEEHLETMQKAIAAAPAAPTKKP